MLPQEVGPFQFTGLKDYDYIKSLLRKINLRKVKAMNYESHAVITKMRLEKKKYAYEYQPRLKWESIANKETLEEVQEVRRKLKEERERLAVQKMGIEEIIDVMEVDEGEQYHPTKIKRVEELQEE